METRITPSWGSVPPSTVALSGVSTTATPLALNAFGDQSGQADVASNEVDWYKLVVPVSGTYRISTNTLASGLDTVLALYNASGYRVAYNDDTSSTNNASSFGLNLSAGQTVYVGVTNFTGTTGGAYGWTVDGPAVDDKYENNDTMATAYNLGAFAPRAVSGLRLVDLDDYYKFSITKPGTAQQQVAIDFSDAQGDLGVALYNSAGQFVRNSDTDADREEVNLQGLAAGTYFVRVYSYFGDYSPDYTLTFTAGPADDIYESNDTQATASNLGTVTSIRTVSGLALQNDDWFKFTTGGIGAAGNAVSVVFSNVQGNIDLKLYDASGVQLGASETDGDGESVSLQGLAAGTYYVQVFGRSGATNPTYTLTVSPPVSTSWYTQTLTDTGLRGVVQQLNTDDGKLSRGDLLQVFAQVELDGSVSTTEYNDLKTIVGNTTVIQMDDPTRVLSKKVVLANTANAHYQGTTLGNLAAGNTAAKLQNLVNKWFLGLDHPVAAAGSVYTAANGVLFASTISYTDVNQGQVGDCYYLVALGSVAEQNSQVIRQMFTDNGDGTLTVKFYKSGVADYVTVDRMLPTKNGRFIYANMGDVASNAGNVLWVALAEKAYAQLNEAGGLGQEVAANSYISIQGGMPNQATAQVTGASTAWAYTTSATFSAITSKFDAGKYVTFGSRTSVASNVVPNHAYVMVGYNAANGTVTLYNPWGESGGYYGGTLRSGYLTLTVAQLRASFDAWYYN